MLVEVTGFDLAGRWWAELVKAADQTVLCDAAVVSLLCDAAVVSVLVLCDAAMVSLLVLTKAKRSVDAGGVFCLTLLLDDVDLCLASSRTPGTGGVEVEVTLCRVTSGCPVRVDLSGTVREVTAAEEGWEGGWSGGLDLTLTLSGGLTGDLELEDLATGGDVTGTDDVLIDDVTDEAVLLTGGDIEVKGKS